MTLVQAIALFFGLLFVVVSTLTSVKLLRIARRTGKSPELLMGIGLAGTGPFGFGLSVAAGIVAASEPMQGAILRLAGTIAVSVASLAFALFTQRVFRPGRGWALALVGLSTVAFIALFAVTLQDHWRAGPDQTDPAMLGRGALLSFVWAWMGLECLRYRGVLRRRLALDLADPLVVNRFTLWAFVSIESFLLNSICTVLSFRAGGQGMSGDDLILVTGVLGMSGAVAIYLAFAAPRAYQRWVTASAEAVSS